MTEKVRDRTFNHHTYKPHKYGYDITPKKYIIGEGAYSMYSYFGDDYDLGIFCDVDPITQMKRQRCFKIYGFLRKKPILKISDSERKDSLCLSRFIRN